MPDRPSDDVPALDAALHLIGPLEGRIMREVWLRRVVCPFFVRDMLARMPELAYTTVMTTLNRLADKGLLQRDITSTQRAYPYRPTGTPEDFLRQTGQAEVDDLIARFGDAALAAFAARMDSLSPHQRRRLQELADQ
ncbi:MAG: BlaI/MecI/CopY family transcriptional regulator [Candidatus Dormibacteria bacterium]